MFNIHMYLSMYCTHISPDTMQLDHTKKIPSSFGFYIYKPAIYKLGLHGLATLTSPRLLHSYINP